MSQIINQYPHEGLLTILESLVENGKEESAYNVSDDVIMTPLPSPLTLKIALEINT